MSHCNARVFTLGPSLTRNRFQLLVEHPAVSVVYSEVCNLHPVLASSPITHPAPAGADMSAAILNGSAPELGKVHDPEALWADILGAIAD